MSLYQNERDASIGNLCGFADIYWMQVRGILLGMGLLLGNLAWAWGPYGRCVYLVQAANSRFARIRMSADMLAFDQSLLKTRLADLNEGRLAPASITRASPLEEKTALVLHLQTQTMVPSNTLEKRLESADDVVLKKFLSQIESLYGKKPVDALRAQKALAALLDLSKVDSPTLTKLLHDEESQVVDMVLQQALQESLGRDGIEAQLQKLGLSKDTSSVGSHLRNFSGKSFRALLKLSSYSSLLVGLPPAYLPKFERLQNMLRSPEISEQIAKYGIDSVYPFVKAELGDFVYMQAWWQGVRGAYLRTVVGALVFYGVYEGQQLANEIEEKKQAALAAELKRLQEEAVSQQKMAQEVANKQEQIKGVFDRLQNESLDDLAMSLIAKLRARYKSDTDPDFIQRRDKLLKRLQEIKEE